MGHCPESPLGHLLGSGGRLRRHVILLEIGRQEQAVVELGAPRSCSPNLPTHVGPIGDGALVDGGLQVVREG